MLKTAPRATPTAAHKLEGEMWAMGAVAGYTGANLLGRAAVEQGNPLAAPLVRDLPSLVMGLVLGVRGGHLNQLRPGHGEFMGRRLLAFVASGLGSALSTFAFFFALDVGGVNIAVPVIQTQIIFGALFAWLLLGERVTPKGVLGILVTLAGLVVLGLGQSLGVPVSPSWHWGLLLALVPAIGWGASGVIWRHGQQRGIDRSTGITVHYGVSVLSSALFLLLSGQFDVYSSIRAADLWALLGSGIFGGVIAVYSMFNAMRLLPAATVFVLNGTAPLFTALGGALFLGEYINALMGLGIVLASAGVLLFQVTGIDRGTAAAAPLAAPAGPPPVAGKSARRSEDRR